MATAISDPTRKALSLEEPFSKTNKLEQKEKRLRVKGHSRIAFPIPNPPYLSVSPYTTLACQAGCASMNRMARSRVRRPVSTIASAMSTDGIRPEKEAAVYPYDTLAIYLRANCRLSRTLLRFWATEKRWRMRKKTELSIYSPTTGDPCRIVSWLPATIYLVVLRYFELSLDEDPNAENLGEHLREDPFPPGRTTKVDLIWALYEKERNRKRDS
jgi:hypothetical protein